jgi:uncharacterized protein
MGSPYFGLEFIQVDDQPQPVLGANMDVIGIIGPAAEADAATFPLDTPILVFSNDLVTLKKLGTDGYIPDAINGINAQLADFEIAAQLVIVRTAYGSQSDANLKLQQTIAKIMGNSNFGTGVHAFLNAPNTLYCTPRIILAPGYTGQMANSLDTLVANVTGVGYIPNATYQVTFAPGGGETNGANLVLPMAHAVADANGMIDDAQIFIDSWGAWFTVAPTATLPVHDGTPAPAAAAMGQIAFTGIPGIGAKITFNSQDVTFIAHGGTPSAHQVALGLNLSDTLDALVTYLMGGTAQADANIGLATYTKTAGGTLLALNITAKAAGIAGNNFTVGSTVTGASWPPHLTGGVDAQVAADATLTATMALGANPVCAELTGVLDTLLAHAIVESPGTSTIGDENWRDTLNSQRLIGLSGGVKVIDPNSGNVVVMPLAPRAAGAMVAVDFSTGYPFHSFANRAIQGIVGPARTIAFSLTDGSTEGQLLLAANLGVLVRGLIGVETAISSGGFIIIATDNMGDDELWRMYNVKRGRDYIHLSLMPALRVYLGRTNIDRQTVTNIEETIANFLSQLVAFQQILGYEVKFQGNLNSADEIRLGHLAVSFAAEEPPVLKRITTMSARYRPAIDAMVAQLAEQLTFAG